MEFLKSKVFMAIVIAVIFAAAIAGVLYGVLTHEEPGLMRACRQEGTTLYDYNGDCFDVRLEGAGPFVVDIGIREGTVPSMNYPSILQQTLDAINYRVGQAVLIPAGDLDDGICSDQATICLHPEQPREEGWMDTAGDARHWVDVDGSGEVKCTARTSNTGTTELEGDVEMHELGHCLGLAHDDFESSIMRPIQTPTPTGSMPPWISDSDRDLLRRTYSPISQ